MLGKTLKAWPDLSVIITESQLGKLPKYSTNRTKMKVLTASLLSLMATTLVATPSMAAPYVSMAVVDTPFGSFACKQRAQNKMYAMGATRVSNLSSGSTIWGYIGEYSLGVWCRGQEAVIVVAGDSDTASIRDDLKTAF
jgi:hypothetical protein